MLSFYRHLDIGEEWLSDVATFNVTDYLDDISGVYANPDNLSPLAVELADRTNAELYPPEGINGTSYGLQRGNPTDKDWYTSFGVILTYQFRNKSSCPSWK